MKILELNFEKGWRGGERQTIYCMQGLSKAGVEVALACRSGSPLEAKARENGFTVHAFSGILSLIRFLILQGKNFDCLHAQTSSVLTYCVFTKWIHGRKTMYSRRVNFMPRGFLTRMKYRFTDKLIAISPAIQQTLQAFTGRRDIPVISSIAVKEMADNNIPNRCMEGISLTNKKCIATMAAFTYEKDPFTAIEAIKLLSQQRNDFLFLHFGEGKLKEAVKEKIKRYGLEKTYLLMGFTENPQACFGFFDVFLMTSTEEGLGSSVLDAFMYEVPVVSTDAGGLKYLLAEGRGISVSTGDAAALAAGMNTMLEYPKEHNPFVTSAKSYVEKSHGMEAITHKLLQELKLLV